MGQNNKIGTGVAAATNADDVTLVSRTTGEAIGTATNPLATTPGAGVSMTDASIANASGASETIAAASTTRRKLIVANPSATSWWINASGGTAAANTAGSFELPSGAMWTPDPAPTNAVTGIGTLNADLTVVVG